MVAPAEPAGRWLQVSPTGSSGTLLVDFLCISARLAIEVDGPFHEDEADRRKTFRLAAEGYRVLRIPVTDIDETLDDVVHGIYLKLSETSLPERISPPGVARLAGEADLPA